MLEFIVCLPLLILVIGGTYFFGMVMRDDQRLCASDRYHAWRIVHNADAKTDMKDQGHKLYGEPDEGADRTGFESDYTASNIQNPDAEYLTETFFFEDTEGVSVSHHGGVRDTMEELEEVTYDFSQDAGDLAKKAMGSWPHGSVSQVDATFPKEEELLKRLTKNNKSSGSGGELEARTYKRRGYRDGVQWRRWQSSYLQPIRELFLYELDEAVKNIDDSQLRDNIQDLYLRHW